jgi:two-component system response regulator WspF
MRIAIVNDTIMAVEMLRRVVTSVSCYDIAWVAYDGQSAIAYCARDTPDLILMDMIMPRVDGVEATRVIMKESPCAILIVTANVKKNSSKIFEAMGYGALDVVSTPVVGMSGDTEQAQGLLNKIATIGIVIDRVNPKDSPPPYSVIVAGKSIIDKLSNPSSQFASINHYWSFYWRTESLS